MADSETLPSMSSEGWFTTLGDLLTLLLCFFLSAVSFSTFTPKDESLSGQGQSNNFGEIEGNGQKRGLWDERGTSIAPPVMRDFSVTLVESDFRTDDRLSAEAMAKLSGLSRDGKRVQRLEIVTCEPVGTAVGWFRSISRSLLIRKSLVMTGAPDELIRISVNGSRCETQEPGVAALLLGKREIGSNG